MDTTVSSQVAPCHLSLSLRPWASSLLWTVPSTMISASTDCAPMKKDTSAYEQPVGLCWIACRFLPVYSHRFHLTFAVQGLSRSQWCCERKLPSLPIDVQRIKWVVHNSTSCVTQELLRIPFTSLCRVRHTMFLYGLSSQMKPHNPTKIVKPYHHIKVSHHWSS